MRESLKFHFRNFLPTAHFLGQSSTRYAGWGATQKARLLLHLHPGLIRTARSFGGDSFTTTDSTTSEVLDVNTIAKATRVISGELMLDRLLEHMMEIISENAGAQIGSLVLLEENGSLRVAAWRAPNEKKISTKSIPLSSVVWLPSAIIQYVARTNDSIVLDDAAKDRRFRNDALCARMNQNRCSVCLCASKIT